MGYDGLSLSTLSAFISYIRPLDASRRIVGILNTGVYSDFKDVSAEDFNTFASVLLNRDVNSTFSYNYGIAYSNNFYGNLILPYFGFSKKITSDITLDFQNPINPSLIYKHSETLTFGLSPEYTSRHYRLSNSLDSQVHQSRDFKTSTYVDITLNSFLVLNVAAGYNFMHKIEVFEDQKNTSSQWYNFSSDQDPVFERTTEGAFVELGLKLNLGSN